MKIGKLDTDEKVFIIAEVGNNHEGDFARAQEMVGLAVQAGVDAVKFQTINPELFVRPQDTDRLAQMKRFAFTTSQFEQLARQAEDAGVLFFSTPFDQQSAEFLDQIQPVFKIASGDNTFYPLIEKVAGFGKPMIISSGLADIAVMRQTHDKVMACWAARNVEPGLAILHCVASYPVPDAEANLATIVELNKVFPSATIGYSDHTLGTRACVLAVAAGARILEKHFTYDKTREEFRDHLLSADLQDMREIVDRVREAEQIMGSAVKHVQSCEAPLQLAIRRSITARTDLKKGQVLCAKDITWMRPGGGFEPGREGELIGRRLTSDLEAGDWITGKELGD